MELKKSIITVILANLKAEMNKATRSEWSREEELGGPSNQLIKSIHSSLPNGKNGWLMNCLRSGPTQRNSPMNGMNCCSCGERKQKKPINSQSISWSWMKLMELMVAFGELAESINQQLSISSINMNWRNGVVWFIDGAGMAGGTAPNPQIQYISFSSSSCRWIRWKREMLNLFDVCWIV